MRAPPGLYPLAAAIGVAAALAVLPAATILGSGPGWLAPFPDQAQTLTGHLAFQADAWHWPPLHTTRLFPPQGVTIALTDSNPLVSLLAKLWAKGAGSGPANWLGGFLALCWVLQAMGAAYAARGLGAAPGAALAAAAIACAWPALLARMAHINLCGHAVILFALGLAFRATVQHRPFDRARHWAAPAALLLAAILTHPYLFQLCAAVLAAIPVDAALRRRPGWHRVPVFFALSGVLAAGTLILSSGLLGGGDKGFVFFSMNLASPFWPQRSGVFGADLPVLDATGGQYEGYNWLGAGTMALLAALLVQAAVRRAWPRPPLALVLVLGGLALLSLSSRVYLGPWKVLDLGAKPWEDIFASFRAPGRAFWPVGYALMLAAATAVGRMPRRVGGPLLAAAVVLQLIDVRPVWKDSRAGWESGFGIALPRVPPGTALFTVAPHPGCTRVAKAQMGGPLMILDAVRAGAMAGDVGLGRSPRWFSCQGVAADALELPLRPGEVRAFVEDALPQPLHPALLGPQAECRRSQGIVLCARDQVVSGEPVAPGPPPPVLLSEWVMGADGAAWTMGSRSSLLIPAGVHRLRLGVAAVAVAAGGDRVIGVRVDDAPSLPFTLRDGVETALELVLSGDAPSRIVLDMPRAADPARRGIAAPVHRTALRLLGIQALDRAGNPVPVATPLAR